MEQQDLLKANYFPIELTFKIGTLHNDFRAIDSLGQYHAYVKQKLFKFKEHVLVYADETQKEIVAEIKADKWLDFNTCYTFFDKQGAPLGKLLRKGWRSLWKASYDIYDQSDLPDLHISETNPWA
jgi:hypothetical protein